MCLVATINGNQRRAGYRCDRCGQPIVARPAEFVNWDGNGFGQGCLYESNPFVVTYRGEKIKICHWCADKWRGKKSRLHDSQNKGLRQEMMARFSTAIKGDSIQYCRNAGRWVDACVYA